MSTDFMALVGLWDGIDGEDLAWLVAAVLAVAAFAAAVRALFRNVLRPAWRVGCSWVQRLSRAADSILGYEAIVDPATGRVLQDATPPIAHRVSRLETGQADLAAAMLTLADVDTRLTGIADRQQAHEEWSERFVREKSQDIEDAHDAMWAAIAALGGTRPAA